MNNNDDKFEKTAIKNELKEFERIKKKNEMDLINSVEYFLKKKITLKEAELKSKKQNLKVENFQKEIETKHKIELLKKEKRELLKKEKKEKEEEERKKLDLEKYLKDKERAEKEIKKEEERIKEKKKKHK